MYIINAIKNIRNHKLKRGPQKEKKEMHWCEMEKDKKWAHSTNTYWTDRYIKTKNSNFNSYKINL